MPYDYLENFMSNVKEQVPGFVSVSIVYVKTGDILISEAYSDKICAKTSAVFQTEIYKQAVRSILEYDKEDCEEIKEILIISDNRIFLISTEGKSEFLTILVVNSNKANLGFARTILEKNRKLISSQLERDFIQA